MDWARAGIVAAIGFLGVCLILALLSLSSWITGTVIFKIFSMKSKQVSQEEGEK